MVQICFFSLKYIFHQNFPTFLWTNERKSLEVLHHKIDKKRKQNLQVAWNISGMIRSNLLLLVIFFFSKMPKTVFLGMSDCQILQNFHQILHQILVGGQKYGRILKPFNFYILSITKFGSIVLWRKAKDS